jgi:hypothetical protein
MDFEPDAPFGDGRLPFVDRTFGREQLGLQIQEAPTFCALVELLIEMLAFIAYRLSVHGERA